MQTETSIKLALNYTIFAVIATIANIGSQDLFLRWYHFQYEIVLSVLVGTIVGLVVKYWLDKRYIFRFRTSSMGEDSWLFTLYSLMGIVTTAIFWGFEFSFHYWFNTDFMRYTGGVLGLAIGYLMKYQLDKRFVFIDRNLS